jgi:outer membrane lipoprotein carrier protein
MAKSLRAIVLTVDAAGQIHSMRIEQVDGSITSFTFSDIRENIPTTAADFTFTPPAGVTIVNGAAPI